MELHVACDNYATHKHADVRGWLACPENQRITLHFTPTGCSRLNLVEGFFILSPRKRSCTCREDGEKPRLARCTVGTQHVPMTVEFRRAGAAPGPPAIHGRVPH